MTVEQITKDCKQVINALVDNGKHICDDFQCRDETSYYCRTCGYSQYIHLAKQIVKAEK